MKKKCACIASKTAAVIYNMPIITENIADNLNNYTRFLILSKIMKSFPNPCILINGIFKKYILKNL